MKDVHARAIKAHLRGDGEIKTFAYGRGISTQYAYRLAKLAGFRLMQVTDKERALIMSARKRPRAKLPANFSALINCANKHSGATPARE